MIEIGVKDLLFLISENIVICHLLLLSHLAIKAGLSILPRTYTADLA